MLSNGDQVWQLHLAFQRAAGRDFVYSPSFEDVQNIREYTQNNEGDLALELILAEAHANLPSSLRDRACEVAGLFGSGGRSDEVDAWVDGWLQWNPEDGTDPPYGT